VRALLEYLSTGKMMVLPNKGNPIKAERWAEILKIYGNPLQD